MKPRAARPNPRQRAKSLPRRLTPKQRGEIAEARFLAKVLSLGYVAAKPFGDSAPYDCLVDIRGRISRVQVKSAWTASHHRYCLNTTMADAAHGRWGRWRTYRPSDADFLAAYLAHEDTWYIIPIRALRGRKMIYLFPRARNTGLYLHYREAWRLLRKGPPPKTKPRALPKPRRGDWL